MPGVENQFIFALAFGVSSLAIGVEKGRGCKGCRTRRGRPPAKERAFVTPPGAIYEKVPARPSFSATAKTVGLVSPKLTARRGRGQGPFLFLAFPIAMALALEGFLTRPKCWLEKIPLLLFSYGIGPSGLALVLLPRDSELKKRRTATTKRLNGL